MSWSISTHPVIKTLRLLLRMVCQWAVCTSSVLCGPMVAVSTWGRTTRTGRWRGTCACPGTGGTGTGGYSPVASLAAMEASPGWRRTQDVPIRGSRGDEEERMPSWTRHLPPTGSVSSMGRSIMEPLLLESWVTFNKRRLRHCVKVSVGRSQAVSVFLGQPKFLANFSVKLLDLLITMTMCQVLRLVKKKVNNRCQTQII